MKMNIPKYVRHHHVYELPVLLKLIEEKRSAVTGKALDFGCGKGDLSYRLANMGYDVTGLDISEYEITRAKGRYPGIRFISADIDTMQISELENKFDLILAVDVIEHLLYPRKSFTLMHKLLKTDGTLIVSTPFHGYLKNLGISIIGGWDKHFTALSDGGHIKFFSTASLRTLLEAVGFRNIRFYYAGRMPFLWKAMICSCNR